MVACILNREMYDRTVNCTKARFRCEGRQRWTRWEGKTRSDWIYWLQRRTR